MASVPAMVMLVAVLGVAAFAGNVALRRLAPDLGGVPAALAWGLLATTALIVQHLAPLALGLLSRGSVLATYLRGTCVAEAGRTVASDLGVLL